MTQHQNQIPINDLINCISDAIDLINPKIIRHHKRVAYLTVKLAKTMNLSSSDQDLAYTAALLHDIGAVANTSDEIDELLTFDVEQPHLHAMVGCLLLRKFEHFKAAAIVV